MQEDAGFCQNRFSRSIWPESNWQFKDVASMTWPLIARLGLDLVAAGLLLLAFAYNWLGNAFHELMGTGLFLLLISHNLFNRRWYGTITKKMRGPRGVMSRAINLSLLATMLVLLVTSVVISQTVFSHLPLTSSFTTRQLHTMAGYLALLIVSVHLGMSWALIMATLRAKLGVERESRVLAWFMRIVTLFITVCGINGLFALRVGSKLSMQAPVDFGSFQLSATALIFHHVAIVGLGTSVAYYALKLFRNGRDKLSSH
jgi:hypothetical protein